MRRHRASLDALEVFESAAQHLSFSQAPGCCLLTDTGPQVMQTQPLPAERESTLDRIRPGHSRHGVIDGATTDIALHWRPGSG